MTTAPRSPFPPALHTALEEARELYVATERPDGSRSPVTRLWFMYDGEAVYFTTAPTTFKARRAARGGALHVHVGTPDGPYFRGVTTLLRDPALAERMRPVYRRRYWLAWLGVVCPSGARVRTGKTAIVRVVPANG